MSTASIQPEGGEIIEALMAIAEDLLIRQGQLRMRSSSNPSLADKDTVLRHARHSDFVGALEQDAFLGQVTQSAAVELGIPNHFEPDRGLAAHLINAAAWHAVRVGRPTRSSFRTQLACALEELRATVDRGYAEATAVVAFTLHIPESVTIDTPWGRLRPRRNEDDIVVQNLAAGERVFEGGSILERPIEYRWTKRPDGGQAFHVPINLHDDQWRAVSLACLLTLGPENARPVTPWLSTAHCPFLAGVPGGGMRTRLMGGPRLEPRQVSALKSWSERVAGVDLPPIALHRTSSMFERWGDAADSFIDAVIVWESLFGTGDTAELSYRVSMNMACVITDDPAQRAELQNEIKQLYSKRSRVVHGGLRLGAPTSGKVRNRSRELTILAWQGLLSKHPGLVSADARTFIRFVLGTLDSFPIQD